MSDYISERCLILILKHLPVKTLLQFRSVCKWWKQLIDSPVFVLDHLSLQSPTFIVRNGSGRKFFVVDPHRPRLSVKSLNKPIPGDDFHILGTLHGLVCLFNIVTLLIWNPSIRKKLSIHMPKPITSDPGMFFVRIARGFWITPSTKEFKIIFLLRRPAVSCFLYSSVRGDWTIIPTPANVKNWNVCKDAPPVMIGDVAHWGGCLDKGVQFYNRHHCDDDQETEAILSFDFMRECFEIIELDSPDLYRKRTHFRWKDTLSLVCWRKEEFPHICKIFLRRDDSWVGMFRFEVSSFLEHVFWAMEDLEVRNKRGKGKRKREEAQENVRVIATAELDFEYLTCELVLEGTRSGSKTVKKGCEIDVKMAYDFVESLLFP